MICSMPFFEILMLLERFKEDVEKENQNSQKQSEETNAQMSSIKSSMPRVSDFKIPSMQMPSIPKF